VTKHPTQIQNKLGIRVAQLDDA